MGYPSVNAGGYLYFYRKENKMSEKDRLKMKYLIDTTIDLINIEREMDTACALEPDDTTAQV